MRYSAETVRFALRRLRARSRYGDPVLADRVARRPNFEITEIVARGGEWSFPALDLVVPREVGAMVFESLPSALRLVRTGPLRFDAGRLTYDPGDGPLEIGTAQEIRILEEVFVDGLYGFAHPREHHVWDVGANVGYAAAWFAGRGLSVDAYELFPPTAEAASRNLSGRPGVTVHAVGVGARDETLTLPYDPSARGSNGLFGNHALEGRGTETTVEAHVRDAAAVFDEVEARAAGRPILLKVDCEGAEYAIFDRLAETGRLAKISAILGELHRFVPEHDPEAALRLLVDHGFAVRPPTNFSTHTGMFSAVNVASVGDRGHGVQ